MRRKSDIIDDAVTVGVPAWKYVVINGRIRRFFVERIIHLDSPISRAVLLKKIQRGEL